MISYFMYVIRLNKSSVYYIGSSGKLKDRIAQHRSNLRTGKHRNVKLQKAWDESGSDDISIETFVVKTRREAYVLEEAMIRANADDTNMANISLGGIGGDNISRHPRIDDIRKRKSADSIRYWYSMTEEERIAVRDLKGAKNPMYGRKHTEESRRKISEKLVGVSRGVGRKLSATHVLKISERAKLRTGDKNPFFGKKHSPETRRLISERNKGTPSPTRKAIRIDGTFYETQTAAALALDVSVGTISHRLRSKNPKYDKYESLGLASKLSELT